MKLKTFLTVVFLVLIMGCFFMGQFYQTLGDGIMAGTMTLIVFGVMGGLACVATITRQHEGSLSQVLHIVGIVIGVIYVLLGWLFVVPVCSHFWYVNGEKQNIQAQADSVIVRTNEMLTFYKKMSDNRALRLEEDLKKSQHTSAGRAEFSKAYPGKRYDTKMPSTERLSFSNRLLSTFNNIKNEWKKTYEPEFSSKLAQEWSVFYSPENAKLLADIVKDYSEKLQKSYQNTTSPFERLHSEQPTFDKQVSANYIVNKFTNSETDSVWTIVLCILLILSASSFIFVQGTHVKSQTKKDMIYDSGYDI